MELRGKLEVEVEVQKVPRCGVETENRSGLGSQSEELDLTDGSVIAIAV